MSEFLDLMNALKYHWCETSFLSQAVLKHVVSKDIIIKKFLQGMALYPATNEEIYGIVYMYIKCLCQVTKRKLQHVGHKWVICGSHPD